MTSAILAHNKIRMITYLVVFALQFIVLWSTYKGLTDPLAVLVWAVVVGVVILLLSLNFELAAYIFIISLLFNQDLTTGMRVRVADFIAALLVINFTIKVFITREIKLRKTPLDTVTLFFLFILGLSLVNTKSLAFGTINYVRHIELFLVMYALYNCLNTNNFKRLLFLFLAIVSLNALISNLIFIFSGGGFRSFGLAGNEFTDMVVPASFIAYVFSYFETHREKRILLLLMVVNYVLAVFATGTRGAMVSWVLGFGLTNLALWLHGGVNKKRVLALGVVVPVLLGLLALNFGYQASHGVMSPYKGYVDTVDFRFALWYLALKAFLTHPILGIGLNQFMRLEEVFPAVKFNVLFPYIQGLDAHSVVLNFAANTGLLGLIFLFSLFYLIIKLSWQSYKQAKWGRDAKYSLALTLVLAYVVYSSLYAGSWFWSLNGFEFMFFLAMMLRIRTDLDPIKGQKI